MIASEGSTTRPRITLTGVDQRTSAADLLALVSASPRVEVGILLTADPEGRHRYPGAEWATEMAVQLGKRCAVHVCGRRARRMLLDGEESRSWLCGAGRIQINGGFSRAEVLAFTQFVPEVITQSVFSTDELGLVRASWVPGHQLLVDASGGKGLLPKSWRRPETAERPVGFAGGLSPENLATELPKIAAVARYPWWIDMETGLRDEQDWFSVERALRCVEIFERFLADHPEVKRE